MKCIVHPLAVQKIYDSINELYVFVSVARRAQRATRAPPPRPTRLLLAHLVPTPSPEMGFVGAVPLVITAQVPSPDRFRVPRAPIPPTPIRETAPPVPLGTRVRPRRKLCVLLDTTAVQAQDNARYVRPGTW